MKELALHILDILQNSIAAKATLIRLNINESIKKDELVIIVQDDGFGMDEETLKRVTDPFFTSRTIRKVGLGIPLLKQAAEECEGLLTIDSKVNEGTVLKVVFQHSHIDRAPLGNISETICTILLSGKDFEFEYGHCTDNGQMKFSTIDIKKVLKETPITHPDVIAWIRDNVNSELKLIGASATV
ncbi:Histidine kinase-, DNA gyrase B-, and HSP90-like ATPase [Tindallia magadiensis]|uniref:histidine kinase n=1 Tax=Tindallia magadiensis TaxID=69895 RepID=A0A1I3A775_9FIRM|nr:ATP-binding protein [Tindallia magadiensis]SFH45760.1 Histidine kinase-, DNA gyrase B-, and HSP90-like ATPase [Tindallia magadiensis]